MSLTIEEIRLLLRLLAEQTVIEPTKDFPFRVSRSGFGYSEEASVGQLQAKLSIMLEVVSRA